MPDDVERSNRLTIDFGVKRITLDDETSRRYHLYDNQVRLIMVADQGSPWLAGESPQRVRFAQPDGMTIATLDLPRSGLKETGKGAQHLGHVLILNHAVYAIINEYRWLVEKGKSSPPRYYILEVEQRLWLAQQQNSSPVFLLYDEVPPLLSAYETLPESELPDPIGRIQAMEPDTADYHYSVELSTGQMEHTGLIALALIFLIDRSSPQK